MSLMFRLTASTIPLLTGEASDSTTDEPGILSPFMDIFFPSWSLITYPVDALSLSLTDPSKFSLYHPTSGFSHFIPFFFVLCYEMLLAIGKVILSDFSSFFVLIQLL